MQARKGSPAIRLPGGSAPPRDGQEEDTRAEMDAHARRLWSRDAPRSNTSRRQRPTSCSNDRQIRGLWLHQVTAAPALVRPTTPPG